jgi:hypothetical protein
MAYKTRLHGRRPSRGKRADVFRMSGWFANHFNIRIQDGLERIVFGDAIVGKKAYFHQAKIGRNARELSNFLTTLKMEVSSWRE